MSSAGVLSFLLIYDSHIILCFIKLLEKIKSVCQDPKAALQLAIYKGSNWRQGGAAWLAFDRRRFSSFRKGNAPWTPLVRRGGQGCVLSLGGEGTHLHFCQVEILSILGEVPGKLLGVERRWIRTGLGPHERKASLLIS